MPNPDSQRSLEMTAVHPRHSFSLQGSLVGIRGLFFSSPKTDRLLSSYVLYEMVRTHAPEPVPDMDVTR